MIRRRRVTRLSRSAVLAAWVAPALLLAGCAPTSTDSGAFVIRLGTDTTAVERFTRTPNGFQATAVVRTPRTVVHELEMTLGADGAVERAVTTTRDLAEDGEEPTRRVETVFTGDSATTTVESAEGEAETRSVAVPSEMPPRELNFYSLQQLLVRRALDSGRDTVYMLGEEPVPIEVERPADDAIEFVTPDFGTWVAQLDTRGRIVSLDAGLFGRIASRVDDIDVDAIAAEWAARDAAGEGMGPLSPRDTVEATLGGAALTFDYGRPSKRGRTVFGEDGMVPYGQVWRAGANEATHFTTDRDLEIGEASVPAGTYTLYAIPGPDEWTLVVNRQTEQWGTEYDEERDLARIPMTVASESETVETFTISVEPAGDDGADGAAGELVFAWD
ncbi:MAG: DUF2911 domain-containing protein, partial [Gemmatimonadota bacterium]